MVEEQGKLTKKIENEIVERLFSDGYKSMLFIVQRYTSPEKAADIIQEAFIILSENANKLDLLRPPVPYLRMIAINLAKKNYLAKKNRSEFAIETLVGYELSDEKVNLMENFEKKEMAKYLFDIIATFSEKKRFVANLRLREGLSFDTIAELVGVSSRTAKRYMKKAKEEIEASLKKQYPEQVGEFLNAI